MRHQRPDDLDWLAFCYVVDELPPDKAAEFENRLASDHAAREAVAEAVELTCAVNLTCAAADARDHGPTVAPSAVSAPRRPAGLVVRLAWSGIAASLCLVVVLAYQHDRANAPVADSRQNGVGGEPITKSDDRSERLAVLWSQTREELASVEFDDSAELPPLPAEDAADEDVYATNVSPSWMLAAVLAADGRSMPEEN